MHTNILHEIFFIPVVRLLVLKRSCQRIRLITKHTITHNAHAVASGHVKHFVSRMRLRERPFVDNKLGIEEAGGPTGWIGVLLPGSEPGINLIEKRRGGTGEIRPVGWLLLTPAKFTIVISSESCRNVWICREPSKCNNVTIPDRNLISLHAVFQCDSCCYSIASGWVTCRLSEWVFWPDVPAIESFVTASNPRLTVFECISTACEGPRPFESFWSPHSWWLHSF